MSSSSIPMQLPQSAAVPNPYYPENALQYSPFIGLLNEVNKQAMFILSMRDLIDPILLPALTQNYVQALKLQKEVGELMIAHQFVQTQLSLVQPQSPQQPAPRYLYRYPPLLPTPAAPTANAASASPDYSGAASASVQTHYNPYAIAASDSAQLQPLAPVRNTVRILSDDEMKRKEHARKSHATRVRCARYKTVLCYFFMNGGCPRKNCRYAHGVHELRPRITSVYSNGASTRTRTN